jgi:hypothetical protein
MMTSREMMILCSNYCFHIRFAYSHGLFNKSRSASTSLKSVFYHPDIAAPLVEMISCDVCTFINLAERTMCEMCENPLQKHSLVVIEDRVSGDEDEDDAYYEFMKKNLLLFIRERAHATDSYQCSYDHHQFRSIDLMKAHLYKVHKHELKQMMKSIRNSSMGSSTTASEPIIPISTPRLQSDAEFALSLALEEYDMY